MPRFSTTVSVIASGTALAVLAHLFIDNYHQEISDAVEQASSMIAGFDSPSQLKTLCVKSWAAVIIQGKSAWDVACPVLVSIQHRVVDAVSCAVFEVQHFVQSLVDKALRTMVALMCKWAFALAHYLAARYLADHN